MKMEPAWDDSKENFQPVRDGRKPEVLLDSKSKERIVLQPKGIEAQRVRFVEAIERYTGDDPLEKWVEYIKWTKDTFVSGGKTSELLPLLEKCTREFHQSDQYRNDIRYLRVWIMYADCLPDPSDVFSYMMDHNIGQVHALFFIAYATFCELTRNYALADSTYQKGIQAGAAPLDRLEAKFTEFQHRMVRRIQRKASEQHEGHQEGHQEGQQGARGAAGASERRGLKTIRGPLGARPLDKRRNVASNAGSNSIPIYEDDQFSASTVQPPPRGRMVLPAGHAESQKENVQAAVPWMGQTIKQKSSSVVSKPKDPLDIIEDPEFAASGVGDAGEGSGKARHVGRAHLRQRFDRDGLEEQLSSNPLLLLKNPPPGVARKPVTAVSRQVDKTGTEAAEPGGGTLSHPDACTTSDSPIEKEPSPFDQDVTMATSDAFKAMNCLFTGEAVDDHVQATDCGAAGAPVLELAMTINTRDALNAVNSMFKASFNVEEDRDDTVYLSGNTNEDKDIVDGLMIREDTIFLPNSSSQAVCDVDDATGAFSIREDTIFISRGVGASEGLVEDDTGAFSIREDTVFISNPSQGDRGAALNVATDDVDIHNDENAVPVGLVQEVGPRRNRAIHAPLSPLGTVVDGDSPDLGVTRPANDLDVSPAVIVADRLDIRIVQDDEAEEALASRASRADGDSDEGFAVFEDSQPDQRRINPFESGFQSELVASLNPPVSEWPGVHELDDDEAAACEAVFQRAKNTTGVSIDLVIGKVLGATITGQIGEGAYATVYGATCDGAEVALKVEHPPCPWEFLLCKIIEGRSAPDACRTVNPAKMLLHKNFSCLVMPRGSGTLQDLLNRYLAAKTKMDQGVTATLCLSMFRAVQQLHDNKIVHNDIKPDNILFDVAGDGQDVSVSLIDVGRGVDLELLPRNAVLFGDSGTESFRCIEMRERVPWLWQADAYAVAGVIHCLILGEYLEVERATKEDTSETFIRPRAKLPRSYDAEIWENVFKTLLNAGSTSVDCPPDWDGLCRSMERLVDRRNLTRALRGLLR